VNVALLPILVALFIMGRRMGWATSMRDVYIFVRAVLGIDISLLVFNMLPIYPLDGGQIFRSLLWFVLGRGRSLMVATMVGMLGIAGFFILAAWKGSIWVAAISIFMLMNCWGGLRHAQILIKMAKLPRRDGFACPSCRTAPLLGEKWKCSACGQAFDTFLTGAVCPACGAEYPTTMCGDCGKSYPVREWVVESVAGVGVVNGGVATK
jgi:hypothetical protein